MKTYAMNGLCRFIIYLTLKKLSRCIILMMIDQYIITNPKKMYVQSFCSLTSNLKFTLNGKFTSTNKITHTFHSLSLFRAIKL